MTGEHNLSTLLASMQPSLDKSIYVFVSIDAPDVNLLQKAQLVFHEKESTTLILEKSDAEVAALDYQYPCRMITLNIHSSLNAVGFLAEITQKLAQENISVNAVSAYYHDHLFVPSAQADLAMQVLTGRG